MDKNRIKTVEIRNRPGVQVHHLLQQSGMRQIHRDYGLCIFRWTRDGCIAGNMEFKERRRYFEFYSISHMYRGRGYYWRPDRGVEEIKAGQCVLVSPRVIQNYGNDAGSYHEDTVNFNGPVADMMFRSGVLADGVFDLGLSRRLAPVIELVSDPSDHAQLNANFELQKLLQDLYNRRFERKSIDRYPEIDELLKLLREHPERWWSIEEMAEFCGMSDDRFRRVFCERVGMLPKRYADQLRLHHATALLAGTRLPVREIAEKIGYADEFHFSRRFREVIGISPGQYRKSLRT